MAESRIPSHDLFEANPHPMWVYDLETWAFLEVNDAAVIKYGWSREEFLAMNIREIRPPEDVPALEAAARAYFKGASRTGIWRHLTKRGELLLVEIASHVLAFNGRDARLVVAYDVTQAHEALAAMRASEERFRVIARATTDAVWDWDIITDSIWWNDGVRQILGDAQAAVIATGEALATLIHPADRDRVREGLRSVIRGSAENWSDEYRLKRSDGTFAHVANRGFVIRREDGSPLRMVGGMSDVSEHRSLEQQVLRSQRLESIGTLAGGIAHDLNNMLSPILMSIDLLREHVHDAEGRDILATIEASAQRGADLVRQVLTFARGVDGQRAPIGVRELIRELSRIVVDTFPKDIQLRTDIPEGIWTVIGDKTQMHQVLLNLCVNARDAMPGGGVLLLRGTNESVDAREAATIPDGRSGTFVRIGVSDTGSGIPPRVLERIFEPFFTTKEVGKGTGLGLSTVQAIVRSHGGFIVVRSALREGSAFEVYLPADTGSVEVSGPSKRASPARGAGQLILLVDDEPNIRAFAATLLERNGYRVLTASGGDEAIAMFGARARDVSLVISDVMMPGTDGRSVMKAVRRIAPAVPIIAMSGLDAHLYGHEAEGTPLALSLMKPFTADQLEDAVLRALALLSVR